MAMTVGIVGGSGLYALEGLRDVREQWVDTPYGPPSDALIHGTLDGVPLVFLARHGRGHVHSPSSVPYRANIWALKQAGVSWLISVSAVGSLREAIQPGHVVAVDQFIDRTRGRASTFFERDIVAHISFGDPVCPVLHAYLAQAAREEGAVTHERGTYVCMEGPAFSTRAESELYRRWGADVVGMTNLPEAKLAREAQLAYATLAMATDYDCWHPDHGSVTVEQVIEVLQRNVALARRILRRVAPRVGNHPGPVDAHRALENAILTASDVVDPRRRAALALLIRDQLG